MPVADKPDTSARQAILVVLGGLGGLIAVVFLISQMGQLGGEASEVPVEPGGSPAFVLGEASEMAELVETDGPILLPDASGGNRDVVINHLGQSSDDGWHVFAARPLTSPRDCFVEWQDEIDVFVDTCDGTEYPPDGTGLNHYGITVDDEGNLKINLNVVKTP